MTFKFRIVLCWMMTVVVEHRHPMWVPWACSAQLGGESSRWRATLHDKALELDQQGVSNTPGRTRTCNPRFRRPMLYPLSYGCVESIVAVLRAGQPQRAAGAVPQPHGGDSVVYS